jgi:hypothetical protein
VPLLALTAIHGHPICCRYARLPRTPDERLCTKHVLAMEFLGGTSLKGAIEQVLVRATISSQNIGRDN